MKNQIRSLDHISSEFPSLSRIYNRKRMIYFDGPGGTQVPKPVIQSMSEYYRKSNANTHGFFQSSIETDAVIYNARKNMATLLGAEGPDTMSVGQNMTSLNYALSRAFSKKLVPGDEIVITQLDHEANRSPWLQLRQYGMVVREVTMTENGTLDYQDFENKINERTRLVAMGWASNAFGTVNDIERIRKLTYSANALLLVDAVHYAPHFLIDVQKYGIDFLLCSSYKFYGPHLGFLYAKPGILDTLPTERLKTQDQKAPYKIETGTLNHAALAGVSSAIQFIASLSDGDDFRKRIVNAYGQIQVHERDLALYLYDELKNISGVRIIGPTFKDGLRAPTVSFVHEKYTAAEVCKKLADRGIAAWDGHFYALKAIEVLGLFEKGGVTRIGISMYNSRADVAFLVNAIQEL